MPLLRTETGCKCRNTLVSMTTTRLRRSRGAGWRKMLFQTCELRMKSPMDIVLTLGSQLLDQQIGIRVVPLADFFLELAGLVDDDHAFVGFADGVAFERPRCRAFEVDAGDAEAAAVAGAFEFLFGFEP